jgi:hypothetical protein
MQKILLEIIASLVQALTEPRKTQLAENGFFSDWIDVGTISHRQAPHAPSAEVLTRRTFPQKSEL